jgi:hypothetical protein
MVISTGLKILYSFLHRKFVNHINLLYFLLLPCPSINSLSSVWPVFHSCPSLFRCLFIVQWDFCLGIVPVHALCLSQYNPLHCISFPFPLSCLVEQFSVCFFVSCSHTDVRYLIIICYLPFLCFLLPWSPLPVPVLDTCFVYLCVYDTHPKPDRDTHKRVIGQCLE